MGDLAKYLLTNYRENLIEKGRLHLIYYNFYNGLFELEQGGNADSDSDGSDDKRKKDLKRKKEKRRGKKYSSDEESSSSEEEKISKRKRGRDKRDKRKKRNHSSDDSGMDNKSFHFWILLCVFFLMKLNKDGESGIPLLML